MEKTPGFWNIANQLTLFRVLLVFLAALMFTAQLEGVRVLGVALIPTAFALDAVDGWVARRFRVETRFGSFFDVLGDRVTELVLWIYFLSLQLVPFWAVAVVTVRGLATDAIRAEALARGKGVYEMMQSREGKALVSNKFVRGFYGLAKAVLFTLLAWQAAFGHEWLSGAVGALVIVVVATCLARAYPVIVEGRKFFLN